MSQEKSQTVLLVEDDPGLLGLLALSFRRAGYTVETASDGRSALKAIKQVRPAAVVTDLVLPDSEGMQVIKAMKIEQPNAPVVAMSGGGIVGAADLLGMAAALGAHAGLSKPFKLPAVVALVGELLRPPVARVAC